jgi:hypothetical protein
MYVCRERAEKDKERKESEKDDEVWENKMVFPP